MCRRNSTPRSFLPVSQLEFRDDRPSANVTLTISQSQHQPGSPSHLSVFARRPRSQRQKHFISQALNKSPARTSNPPPRPCSTEIGEVPTKMPNRSKSSATIRENPRPNPQATDSKQNSQDRSPPKARHSATGPTRGLPQFPVTFSTPRSNP
jgi:hypothetical protein